jgi:uncharacterized protein
MRSAQRARSKVPTLVVHSENALAPALARKFIADLQPPHEDVWLRSIGQIDFYDDPNLIARATDAVTKFFQARLLRDLGTARAK